jgi:hypothetical protein
MPFIPKKGPMRVFTLDNYVVVRDASGNIIELLTMERVSPVALPESVRALIPEHDPQKNEHDVELYTWVRLTDDNWESHQEINDIVIPESKGTYPKDRLPYIPLRWNVIDGEDYGRGYVEDYLGDLYSLEGLSKAIVEFAAASARVLITVKPGSPVTQRQIAKAPSGSTIAANRDDIGVLQLEKFADFRVAQQTVEDISKRLSFAFLLNTAVQRSGERVTAEEIRYIAMELESALGGTYSVLSQELQLKFLRRIEYLMQQAGELPKLPKEFAEPTIITGLEALGRGQDLAKFRNLFAVINEFGPQVAQRLLARLNDGELLDRVFAASTIDSEGLIKTEEQMMQEMQQQQLQQLAQGVAPQAVGALGGMMKQQIANNAAPAASEAPEAPAE